MVTNTWILILTVPQLILNQKTEYYGNVTSISTKNYLKQAGSYKLNVYYLSRLKRIQTNQESGEMSI